MALENHYDLMKVLLEKTKEQKISWESGPISESYVTTVGKNSVAIRSFRDDFQLIIFDDIGNIIEAVSDDEFKGAGISALASMKELFLTAKGNALGTDAVVNSMINELTNK